MAHILLPSSLRPSASAFLGGVRGIGGADFDTRNRLRTVRLMEAPSFTITRRVDFHETDAAGLMHFSNFYRWMEVCEHEWFRARDLAIMTTSPDGVRRGWPRRESSCSHLRPLRCGDVVRVRGTIAEVGESTVTYDFVFEKDRAGRWTEVARGRMTTVHVRQDDTGRMEAERMPETVRATFTRI